MSAQSSTDRGPATVSKGFAKNAVRDPPKILVVAAIAAADAALPMLKSNGSSILFVEEKKVDVVNKIIVPVDTRQDPSSILRIHRLLSIPTSSPLPTVLSTLLPAVVSSLLFVQIDTQ